jgi:hypothetical protein
LCELQKAVDPEELMILSPFGDHAARLTSYRLLSEEFGLRKPAGVLPLLLPENEQVASRN